MKFIRPHINIVFQEVPDEVSLVLEITNCPYRCEGCHTPELQEDIGEELTPEALSYLITANSLHDDPFISCVLFMGGDHHPELIDFLKLCKSRKLKTALYTGSDDVSDELKEQLDYLKTGKYIKELGPLGSPTTNQKFVRFLRK